MENCDHLAHGIHNRANYFKAVASNQIRVKLTFYQNPQWGKVMKVLKCNIQNFDLNKVRGLPKFIRDG